MEIDKYIKEEIFFDGRKKYFSYIETTQSYFFKLIKVRKKYDLCVTEFNGELYYDFEYENENPISDLAFSDKYADVWKKMLDTEFKLKTSDKPSKINIIKL